MPRTCSNTFSSETERLIADPPNTLLTQCLSHSVTVRRPALTVLRLTKFSDRICRNISPRLARGRFFLTLTTIDLRCPRFGKNPTSPQPMGQTIRSSQLVRCQELSIHYMIRMIFRTSTVRARLHRMRHPSPRWSYRPMVDREV